MIPAVLLRRLVAYLRGLPARPGGPRGAGWDWERLAERRLRREGYRILERNFRGRTGEIDFVAEENGVLCFVEVKGRGGRGFGEPEEAVTLEKQRRIFRVAEDYLLQRSGPEKPCRFDVVAIVAGDDEARISVIRDAFRGPLPPRRPATC